MPSKKPPTQAHHDGATLVALFGLVAIAIGLLGLAAIIVPGILALLLLVVLFAIPAAVHYLVWGRLFKQIGSADHDPADD
jgi:hypothetical protein